MHVSDDPNKAPRKLPANSKRVGRKPKPIEEKRAFRIVTGWTEAELEKLEQRSASVGLREPEFIRRIVLNQPIHGVPAINREAVAQLGRIGNNLNQITRRVNTEPDLKDTEEIRTAVESCKDFMSKLTKQFLVGDK